MKSGKLKILIVDDEKTFVEILKPALENEGFEVATSFGGSDVFELFESFEPDFVLLDIVMPERSGLDVCRWIRSRSDVPVIVVSARTEEIDVVSGLEVGADDYLLKPYRLRELVARIRAVQRRGRLDASGKASGSNSILKCGSVELDAKSHRVSNNGEPIALALKEFELLHQLLMNVGHVVPRTDLIAQVWGDDYIGDTKTLDVHIKRLRAKIEVDPANPTMITTVRGLGYRFEASVEVSNRA